MVGTIILELGIPEIHVSVPLLSTMFSANHRIGGNDDMTAPYGIHAFVPTRCPLLSYMRWFGYQYS